MPGGVEPVVATAVVLLVEERVSEDSVKVVNGTAARNVPVAGVGGISLTATVNLVALTTLATVYAPLKPLVDPVIEICWPAASAGFGAEASVTVAVVAVRGLELIENALPDAFSMAAGVLGVLVAKAVRLSAKAVKHPGPLGPKG